MCLPVDARSNWMRIKTRSANALQPQTQSSVRDGADLRRHVRDHNGGTFRSYIGEGHTLLRDDGHGMLIAFGDGAVEFSPIAYSDVLKRRLKQEIRLLSSQPPLRF